MVGLDPQLTDPAHGDYRPLPGSPATAYGCQTFPGDGPGLPARSGARERAEPRGLLPLACQVAGRSIEVSGPISIDTRWDADTVLVTGEVTVESQVELTIAPGVTVLFEGYCGLVVQGTLTAAGTPGAWIRFDSLHPEAFAVDSTLTGCWHGIRFPWTASANDSSHLAYCIIEHCKAAGDGSRGAALSVEGFSKLAVTNCILRHNVADIGGALYCSNFAAPALIGCLLVDNHGFDAGSVSYAQDAYPALVNCTVVANPVHEEGIFVGTAAVHNHISKSKVINCIVRDNPSHYFLGGQLYEGKPVYVIYSDIEGGYGGAGDFDADPLFVDAGPHPFALRGGSLCIDAGRPDATGLGLPARDLAGGPRVSDGRVDVGAYEWTDPAAVAEGSDPARNPACPRGVRRDAAASGLGWLRWAGTHPASGALAVEFGLAQSQVVRLAIFDATGRLQAEIWSGLAAAGTHVVAWDGRSTCGAPVPPGVYFAQLATGHRTLACARVVRTR